MHHLTQLLACLSMAVVLCREVPEPITGMVIISYPVYDRYTVPVGVMGLACVRFLGFKSVEDLQAKNNMETDGVVGAKTWQAIESNLEMRGVILSTGQLPLIIKLSNIESAVHLVISNQTMGVVSLRGDTATNCDFAVILHVRYSGIQSSGRTYLASKDICVAFSSSREVPSQQMLDAKVQFSSLPKFDGAKIWAECVIAYSNRIAHLTSNVLIITNRGRTKGK